MRLTAPKRKQPGSSSPRTLKTAGFPPQPDQFVGRTAVMAQASAALAPESRLPGVLLHGMPGAGKTACAIELAYTHEHAFEQLVWFKAPDEGRDTSATLTEFALTLERGLHDFRMVHLLDDVTRLAAFLPQLTEVCERLRVLVVIDNIESLVGDSGQWRDARWGQLIAAMCGHTGLGRVVLTSRRLPAAVTGGVLRLALHALSLDEALLLAWELPNLAKLVRWQHAGDPADSGPQAGEGCPGYRAGTSETPGTG